MLIGDSVRAARRLRRSWPNATAQNRQREVLLRERPLQDDQVQVRSGQGDHHEGDLKAPL